jgi:Zn-dependent protease with chaperone function
VFSQLFFLLLALTLITFTSESDLTFWVETPKQAFKWGLLSYLILLILLYGQSKYLIHALKGRLQAFWWAVVNVELLFFLSVYHFGLGAHRFFLQGTLASYQTPYTLFSLMLYFLGLGWAHLWFSYFQLHRSIKKALKSAWQQLLFFCPFCLPFVTISLILDGLEHFPDWQSIELPVNREIILLVFSFCILALTLVFLPACMMICWRCRPLNRPDLKQRLDKMCVSLKFRHAGLKIWSVMPQSFTAGIIGIVPAFRYILFTPALLNRFQPEEIEAILIHEIGHNRYRHLLLYPFIMLGMLILGALLLIGLENGLLSTLEPYSQELNYYSLVTGIFILYALLLGLYFRVVFGFFSRLFERQADLYIFESSHSPLYLIQALDRLGIVTGNTHSHPSWHHDSLQKRIHFLNRAMEDPHLIQHHHRKVRKWLILYFCGLILGSLMLYKMIL